MKKYFFRRIALTVPMSRRMQLVICMRLQAASDIAFASIKNGTLTVYYEGIWKNSWLNDAMSGRPVEIVPRKIKGNRNKAADLKAVENQTEKFGREAFVSLGGFVFFQVMKRFFPQFYISMRLLRSAFVLFSARKIIHDGFNSVVKDREANADTLTATAVIASVIAGKPESSLTLLSLSNAAEMLTSYAAERARKHISDLLSLDQQFTWRIDTDGVERRTAIEDIRPADRICVHLGEKICIDGIVTEGSAAVDQASITGESQPAMKHKNSRVYAGTVVQNGSLTILVEKVGDDTSIARIVHLVEEAQTRRAPVQNFADRMANMLVPVSFIGAALVYGVTRDWQRVMNLLFIDFSCGLKLSTATAVSAAIARAARQGILVKGGNYIETLADIDTVVLDKTGTITLGIPQIAAIHTTGEVTEKELLLLAGSVEMHSIHPLAVAIQKYIKDKKWEAPPHITTETVVARGIRGLVDDFADGSGGKIIVGSRRFMREENVVNYNEIDEFRHTSGSSVVYIARDDKFIGCLEINDPIRPQMKRTLNQLRRRGVDEIVMLTGDTEEAAKEVALKMDLDSYYAEVLPEDKADIVRHLQKNGRVLMVGDGINDAPALSFADVGVALGGRRTDIAVESSDITINSDDPSKLMEITQIGDDTMNMIRQNFTATITLNSIAMVLGALGRINPLVAAIVHNAATLAVVLNSGRILISLEKGILPSGNRK
nr:cation-translocating P-type ATPase [Pectinatus haikarae]